MKLGRVCVSCVFLNAREPVRLLENDLAMLFDQNGAGEIITLRVRQEVGIDRYIKALLCGAIADAG